MCTEQTDSGVLLQEQEHELQELIASAMGRPGQENNGISEQGTRYCERWAGNFGTCQDRRQGRRVLHFEEGLSDMAEDLSLCLEALAFITETVTTTALGHRLASGFCILTSLVCEGTGKTLRALDQERKTVQRQNASLQRQLNQRQVAVKEGSSCNTQ
ncbi:MAG: hypothetical protein KAY65_12655 [Planctomycetes bacterium]|nr:hypothetical protein [Planctomycetota bacterium]